MRLLVVDSQTLRPGYRKGSGTMHWLVATNSVVATKALGSANGLEKGTEFAKEMD